jgi:hypothetical protein
MDKMRPGQSRRSRVRVPFWFRPSEPSKTPGRSVESSSISGTRPCLVTELLFGIGTPVTVSPLMPETEARGQARQWFPLGKAAHIRLDRLPFGSSGIGVELQYHEKLHTGSSDIFSQPTDCEANLGVR